jgi:hypothetical protein
LKKRLLLFVIPALVLASKAVNADTVTPPDVLYASVFRSQGLDFPQVKPWHLKAHYSLLKDGKMETGTFEEWWIAPQKYKLSYARKGFTQTDYAGDTGLFRMGNQQWPVGQEASIHQEITQPLPAMPDAKEAELRPATYNGSASLRCVEVAYTPVAGHAAETSNPVYCMDSAKPVLRLTALHGMHNLTTYNRVTQFQGHYIAEDIAAFYSEKPVFTFTVDLMEALSGVEEATLAPPPGATLIAKEKLVIPGGALSTLRFVSPDYPSMAKQMHADGKVEVMATIDRLGRVVKVGEATGPALLRQPAMDAILRWTFRPFLFCGEATEVDARLSIIFKLN